MLTAATVALVTAGCAAQPTVLACAGCAVAGVALTAHDAGLDDATSMRLAARQTLAGKVLAAMALERVTGRKPDPARFAELRTVVD